MEKTISLSDSTLISSCLKAIPQLRKLLICAKNNNSLLITHLDTLFKNFSFRLLPIKSDYNFFVNSLSPKILKMINLKEKD